MIRAHEMDFARAHAQRGAGKRPSVPSLPRSFRFRSGYREQRAVQGFQRQLLLRRRADRATSIATLPPPITTTFLPIEKR